MKINKEEDGFTHINVYSKGQTVLGRLLSNFADTEFELDGKLFKSVESYWYYIKMTKINNNSLVPIFDEIQLAEICKKVGWEAKQYFRNLYKADSKEYEPIVEELKIAYLAKIKSSENLKKLLLSNNLPFKHYYVFNGNVVEANDYLWTVELWNEIKTIIENEA